LQVLWTLPELRQRYVDAAQDIFRTAPQDPAADFATQFAKVGACTGQGWWDAKFPPRLRQRR
jgi:hypothetical protein